MRSAGLFAVAILAVLIASAAMPASAYINLLQNPGFETGSLAPWGISNGAIVTADGEKPHGGAYFAHVGSEQGGEGLIWQEINSPYGLCAEYLEFWYDEVQEGEVNIYYSENIEVPSFTQNLPETPGWTFVHVDLDTAKLTAGVEIRTQNGGQFSVDDFDLGACSVGAVGGVVMPANSFAIVAPWIALIGVVGCIGTIVVIARKRRP